MVSLDLDDPKHARADEKLRHEIAVWLTTVTSDGQPQSTPVWFYWDGATFLFFSQPGRPKLANIAADPKVSLHLVGDPEGEDVVTIEGVAALDPAAPPLDAIPAYVEKYRSAIDGFGWTPSSMAGDYSVAVRVTPTRFRVIS
ncbi:MAG: TIGR03667 family PPOX class F420-dependent oxidoreductase [Actinomycetota bacterium]